MDAGEDVGEAPAAGRPAPLLEVLPQERVQRRTVEQMVDPVPVVPLLHDVEPQMVEQFVDILSPLDFPVPEQVIEVPKIVFPHRAARTVLDVPQTVEQPVEVPTVVSYSSLFQRTVEQNVDIPVRAWDGTGGLLQGFLRGQFSSSCVEQNVDIPVPHGRDRVGDRVQQRLVGGAEHFPAATAEQIVDIPVPHGGRVLHPASSSSGLPGTSNQGFFSHFSPWEKSARQVRTRGRNWVRTSLRPRCWLSWRVSSRTLMVIGCSFQVVGGNFWARIQKFGGLGDGWDGALVMHQPTFDFGRISIPMCSPSSHV